MKQSTNNKFAKTRIAGLLAVAVVFVMGLAVTTRQATSHETRSTARLAGLGNSGLEAAVTGVLLQPSTTVSTTSPATAPMAVAAPTTTLSPSEELLIKAKELGYAFAAAPAKNRTRAELETFMESSSCTACHTGYDGQYEHTMHDNTGGKAAVLINCVDCHGGNAEIQVPRDIVKDSAQWKEAQHQAHPQPREHYLWETAANPKTPGARTVDESQDYIRFVNPGDLHAATVSCSGCHMEETKNVERSMMAHGAMLWSAALYNNGAINVKNAIFGESYTADGVPRALFSTEALTNDDVNKRGEAPYLYPLPRWNITQPGNILRVFERGGRRRPILGLPDTLEEPGRPETRLSIRGFGTDVRTDPVFIGLQKTRLLDPTLNLFGSNDHPGDYRASGCSACHVVYANDRSPIHSGKWAQHGNLGLTINPDPTMDKTESGHPIAHQFQRNAPSSSCMVCHMHPGTNVVNSYFGYMWWDNETDGKHMYPADQKNPTQEQEYEVSIHNPEQSAARGLWADLYPNEVSQTGKQAGENFLANLTDLNPFLTHTQFADFHGHGWIFRGVYKQDRKGHLLDANGNRIENVTAEKLKNATEFNYEPLFDKQPTSRPSGSGPKSSMAGDPVHMKDIHLERGMQCVDCHFGQDVHGDGKLYTETRAATMIECIDCHGSEAGLANMAQYLGLPRRDRTADNGKRLLSTAFTGAAAANGLSSDDTIARNRGIIDDHFAIKDGRLWQKSALDPTRGWFVTQTHDTLNPDSVWAKGTATTKPSGTATTANTVNAENSYAANNPGSANAARFAHSIRKDGKSWGALPAADEQDPEQQLAHSSDKMSCYACHTSWTTACFGCHLPMRANMKRERLHNEAEFTRNYTNYNFQTLRDDVYMLGIDSTVKGNKIVPIRSSCAVLVSSQDALRQWIYVQQQTVSAEGFSGTAFSSYFPHTVRATETKTCTDCHVAKDNDNNAWMAQVLLQGSNSVNFVGRFAWVGMGGEGVDAVAVAERNEPQAVFGSTLHEMAYPDDYKKFVAAGSELAENHTHHGTVLDLQHRGEYLYAACGKDGFIAYDIANIDNKGFSERFVTAPVSPLGQKFYVDTKYATSVCSPSTMALDPTRGKRAENQEGAVHPLYAYLYVTDKYEGLVVIGNTGKEAKKNKPGVATLLDGDPENNFISRALAFNPGNALAGAKHMALYGTLAYIACDAGIVVVDLDNPLEPKWVTTLTGFDMPRKIAFQFRYAFVVDGGGLKVLDVTDPRAPKMVEGASLALSDARDVYVSRTYAYVAGGKDGLHIIDVEKPEHPVLTQTFNADGKLHDTTAVRVAMTNASMFAYIADGEGGLKVVQLTSPEWMETAGGFSPTPQPKLVSTHHTHGPAIALSEGLDRDRAVDESGNQLAVFGRRGARPFNLAEQQRMFLKTAADGTKVPYFVSNVPETTAIEFKAAKKEEPAKTETPAAPAPGRPRVPGRR